MAKGSGEMSNKHKDCPSDSGCIDCELTFLYTEIEKRGYEFQKVTQELLSENKRLRNCVKRAEDIIDVLDGNCGHTFLDHDLAPCEVSAAILQFWNAKE